MTKPANDIKPMYAFSETANSVLFEIVIDGLRVSSKLTNLFAKRPTNATVLDTEFKEESMNFAIQYKEKLYRLQMHRLPSPINPNKTKIEYDNDTISIKLKKKEAISWRDYANVDFELEKHQKLNFVF